MRRLATLLSVLIFIQFTCWGTPASAATINFTPVGNGSDGTFVGEVVAERIGKLKLDHGVVSVKGNVVDVLVSGADITQKKTVLSGGGLQEPLRWNRQENQNRRRLLLY